MKKLLSVLAVLSIASVAGAQEIGKVIASTQVIQQVSVPRQVCSQEQVAVQPNKSGAGAAMGAIAGGAIGNQIGGGSGKAAATMLGIFWWCHIGGQDRRCSSSTDTDSSELHYTECDRKPNNWVQRYL